MNKGMKTLADVIYIFKIILKVNITIINIP